MKAPTLSGPLKESWERRLHAYGDSPRAVLMKGVPDCVNLTIDRWHRDVLHYALREWDGLSGALLDIGCGYGRLGGEAIAMGAKTLVGLDFSLGFCGRFASRHGIAVCGDVLHLPFGNGSFNGAYAVTALMYLDAAKAREALQALDACVVHGGRVLLLEPGAEFNTFVRWLLRRKTNDPLARPGFTEDEFHRAIVPATWSAIATGSNVGMTTLFPLLLALARIPPLYRLVERLALRLDRPTQGRKPRRYRHVIYRWALYERQSPSGRGLRSTQT